MCMYMCTAQCDNSFDVLIILPGCMYMYGDSHCVVKSVQTLRGPQYTCVQYLHTLCCICGFQLLISVGRPINNNWDWRQDHSR